MIRPSNIDIENHTADFACDEHGGVATSVNVNSTLVYKLNEAEEKVGIVVAGTILTESCTCITVHPDEPTHIKEPIAKLAQAKTE